MPVSFDQLQEGKTYNVFSRQFNVTNRAKLISFNLMPIPVPITYWQFTDRGIPIRTKQRIKSDRENDIYDNHIFAMWKHEVGSEMEITEIKQS